MKKVVVPIAVVVAGIVSALAYKVSQQEQTQQGPPSGSGVVEATAVQLSSRLGTRVTAIRVQEGQQVEAGQLLMELDCSEVQAMLAEVEARAAAGAAEAAAATANIDAMRRSRAAAMAAVATNQARAAALSTRRDAVSRQAGRLEQLGSYASEAQRDEVRSNAEGLAQEVQAVITSERASRQQVQVAAAQAQAAAARADAAQQAVTAAEAGVERARLMVAECSIAAPRGGMVDQIFYEVGELTRPGAPLVRLVDLHDMTAVFYVANAELGRVRVGERARVVADAFPDASFPGTVTTVAVEAEFTPRNIQTRSDRDRLVYAIEVRIAQEGEIRLRPGMPVVVTLGGGGT